MSSAAPAKTVRREPARPRGAPPAGRAREPEAGFDESARPVADGWSLASAPVIQRATCACGGQAGSDGECDACRRRRMLQRAGAGGSSPATAPPVVHQALQRPGAALDPSVHAAMEDRLGAPLPDVRIHTGGLAAQSARAIDAQAYTAGRSIVFDDGRFAPHTESGRALLAHELTHVLQQRELAPGSAPAIDPDPSLEAQARAAEHGALAPSSRVGVPAIQASGNSNPAAGHCGGVWTCAGPTECVTPDKAGTGDSTSWTLTVRIDIDVESAASVTSGSDVGHTLVKFTESNGAVNTFGFYPRPDVKRPDPAFNPKVWGCMVHPDTKHDSCVDYDETFTLTKAEYDAALNLAQLFCKAPPTYELLNFNCTTFAARVVEKAGKTLPGMRGKLGPGGTVTADNPNTLIDNLRDRDVPSRHATSDTEIRAWVSANPKLIGPLPATEKARLVNRLLEGYVHDDDVAAVETILGAVTSATEMVGLRTAAASHVEKLNARQGGRVKAALARNP